LLAALITQLSAQARQIAGGLNGRSMRRYFKLRLTDARRQAQTLSQRPEADGRPERVLPCQHTPSGRTVSQAVIVLHENLLPLQRMLAWGCQ